MPAGLLGALSLPTYNQMHYLSYGLGNSKSYSTVTLGDTMAIIQVVHSCIYMYNTCVLYI